MMKPMMPDSPYARVLAETLILRDYLARDRTRLANERTLLAYIRTALALVLSGISLIKFFDVLFLTIVGWLLMPVGIVTCMIGIRHYIKMDHLVGGIKTMPPPRPITE